VLLSQKRMRLDAAIASHRGELKRLEVGVKTMHDDMSRINALIAKNDTLGRRLATAANSSERAFLDELKDMERECAGADARIASIREERARLLEELVETERQVILWEKKIELEKETQDALDPSVGAGELHAMEKEIGHMRFRHAALRRDQERLVAEMERAIEKRDVIATKHRSARQLTLEAAASMGKGAAASTGSVGATLRGLTTAKASESGALTRVGLQQKAANLRKEIATKLAAAEELDAGLADKLQRAGALAEEVGGKTGEVEELEERARALQRAINAGLYDKQKALERLQGVLRMLQRFEALEAGRMPGLTADEAAHVRGRLREAETARDAILAILDTLAAQHAELADILDRVAQLTATAPEAPPA
jgi:chromosome segregation ATPase